MYGAALVACTGALVTGPRTTGVYLAAVGTAGAFLVTAAVAAPTHGRLGRGRDEALVTRLLRADRFRLGFAVLALVGAVLGGVGQG